MQTQLTDLHALWNRLTGQEIKYQPCERLLWDYLNSEFTGGDLDTVLTFLIWQNRKREPRYRTKLLFHRIVGDLEYFNSVLGEAAAWKRNARKQPTEQAKVVAAFRGESPAVVQDGAMRSIKDVFKALQ